MNIAKFDELYSKIKINGEYKQPEKNTPRMDNWSVDRYEYGNYFAAMADCGYTRWIGECAENGKTMWRVKYFYPDTMIYDQINEEDFDLIEL